MQLSTQDLLKKALLDTQERVRDFMNYADKIEDNQLQSFFSEFAEIEAKQAQILQSFVRDLS